jgi:hypothetical protein
MTSDLLSLPLEIQIAVGGGYLAYSVAYAGLRSGHGATDMTMRSLAFGLVGMFTYIVLLPFTGTFGSGIVAVGACITAGASWRAWGARKWAGLIKLTRVHQDDGMISAWDAFIQSPNLKVTQAMVRLKSGRELFCSETAEYIGGPMNGLLLGSDGGIVIAVESEEMPGGETLDRTHIKDQWGTRMTYVPASEIEMIELRCL